MNENFIKIIGKNKGPKSIIIAGVHGNEKCGIKAIKKLLPYLKIERGVIYIGLGNPLAIKKNKRYIETNLNRMFKSRKNLSKDEIKSYEYNRSRFIKKYLDKSEVLLDIHASTVPKSQPFIICEKNANNISSKLPFKIIVSGFDKIQPGGTDYYMNKIGKIGICIECGYLKDKKSVEIARKSIINFLVSRGHIAGNIRDKEQEKIKIYKQYITKTSNFTLIKKFKDFEKISKNQLIGSDGQKKIKALKDSVIIFPKNRYKIGEEAFLLGEYKKGLK